MGFQKSIEASVSVRVGIRSPVAEAGSPGAGAI